MEVPRKNENRNLYLTMKVNQVDKNTRH